MPLIVATLLAGILLGGALFAAPGCAGPVDVPCADTANCDTSPEDTSATDTTDTDTNSDTGYTGPTEISDIDWNCTGATFTFDVDVVGPSLGADLYITQNTASPWHEVHVIPTLEVSADRSWSKLELALQSVYPEYHEVVEGESTGFDCLEDESTLVFMVDLLDEHSAYVDCGVFGVDPNIFRNECENIWN